MQIDKQVLKIRKFPNWSSCSHVIAEDMCKIKAIVPSETLTTLVLLEEKVVMKKWENGQKYLLRNLTHLKALGFL